VALNSNSICLETLRSSALKFIALRNSVEEIPATFRDFSVNIFAFKKKIVNYQGNTGLPKNKSQMYADLRDGCVQKMDHEISAML
jgi:hypothetical protein